MSVNISAFVLARDFGILDWDDKVIDVVDDRELIISRFVINVSTASHNSVTNSTSDSNDHQSISSDFRKTILYTSKVPSPATKQMVMINSNDNRNKVHRRRSGSFVPGPTNSLESYTYDWNLPSTIKCINTDTSRRTVEKNKFPPKKRYSVDVTNCSLWSIPPPSFEPLIVGPTLHMTDTMTRLDTDNVGCSMFSNVLKSNEMNPTSLKYSRYPYSQSLSTDSDVSKNCSPELKYRKGSISRTIHTSTPSFRSHSDGKSMPRSYYSSLESTAISDCNHNSSLDDGQLTNVTESSIITNTNHIDNDGRQLFSRTTEEPTSISFKSDHLVPSEEYSTGVTLSAYAPIATDLNDNPTPGLSSTSKEDNNHNDFRPRVSDIRSLNPDRTSASLNLQSPPPIPPMRSPSTKLTSNPMDVAFHSLKISHPKSTAEIISDVNSSQMPELPLLKKLLNLTKSEYSSTTFFDSELQTREIQENEVTTNERKRDKEVMPTTNNVSINQILEHHPSVLTSISNNNENLMVTLKKSANGFGFSLTSRQNAVDLTNPVYVSKILEKGPAISDGRMKAGDRILMINNEDVMHLSQKEIKDILLNIPVDSFVIIGLYRPNSDAISSILVSSNLPTLPVKNAIFSAVDIVGDENESHQKTVSIEEQKPTKFTMCDCVYNHSVLASQFVMYHFNILHKNVKTDHLTPKFVDRVPSDTLPKSPDTKSEPPAIQLHHQNKLSPSPLSIKSTIDTKYSHATLGISVRKGFSQLFFNDYESVRQSETGVSSSLNKLNADDKQAKVSHKICPNCHGLLSLKDGVFVTAIISGGAAYLDGRLEKYDEIIAVQGICLVTGEEFTLPNNKDALLGDLYEPEKLAQISFQFLNRVYSIDSNTPAFDVSKKSDPLNLLKQLLNNAQSTSSSVSLVILRRTTDKRDDLVQTSITLDSNNRNNVTVEADVHIQYSKEKSETIISPNLITSNNSAQIISIKDRVKQFEDNHRKSFHGNDDDDTLERKTSTDLICLDSDHESDIGDPVNKSNSSQVDKAKVFSIARLQDELQKPNLPTVKTSYGNTIYSVESSNQPLTSSSTSLPSPVLQFDLSIYDELDPDSLYPLYFSREDNTRQSFSLRRKHLNPEATSRMSRLNLFKDAKVPFNAQKFDARNNSGFKRPKSEVILSRVEEESSSSDVGQVTDIENSINKIDRKVVLKRRTVIRRNQSRKSST